MKKLLGVIVAAVIFAGGAAVSSTAQEYRHEGQVAPRAAVSRSPAESRWLSRSGEFSKTLSKALGRIGEILSDPLAVQRLLPGDEEEIARLVVPIATLQQCPSLWASVGRPPTHRLLRTYNLIKRACWHFRQCGLLFARGFDNRDVATINRATAQMREGSSLIVKAGASLKRIK
jgi:hypothetical protein